MTAGRTLAWLLRGTGAVMLPALAAVVAPAELLGRVSTAIGMGPLPEAPVVLYLARHLSGVYAGFGVLMFVLATDVQRYRPVIITLALILAGLGLLLTAILIGLGLGRSWLMLDGLFACGFAVAAIWLARQLPANRQGPQP